MVKALCVLGRGELGKREVEGREIEEKRDISFAWQTRETKERVKNAWGPHFLESPATSEKK